MLSFICLHLPFAPSAGFLYLINMITFAYPFISPFLCQFCAFFAQQNPYRHFEFFLLFTVLQLSAARMLILLLGSLQLCLSSSYPPLPPWAVTGFFKLDLFLLPWKCETCCDAG